MRGAARTRRFSSEDESASWGGAERPEQSAGSRGALKRADECKTSPAAAALAAMSISAPTEVEIASRSPGSLRARDDEGVKARETDETDQKVTPLRLQPRVLPLPRGPTLEREERHEVAGVLVDLYGERVRTPRPIADGRRPMPSTSL